MKIKILPNEGFFEKRKIELKLYRSLTKEISLENLPKTPEIYTQSLKLNTMFNKEEKKSFILNIEELKKSNLNIRIIKIKLAISTRITTINGPYFYFKPKYGYLFYNSKFALFDTIFLDFLENLDYINFVLTPRNNRLIDYIKLDRMFDTYKNFGRIVGFTSRDRAYSKHHLKNKDNFPSYLGRNEPISKNLESVSFKTFIKENNSLSWKINRNSKIVISYPTPSKIDFFFDLIKEMEIMGILSYNTRIEDFLED